MCLKLHRILTDEGANVFEITTIINKYIGSNVSEIMINN